jgi:hypothetical protein
MPAAMAGTLCNSKLYKHIRQLALGPEFTGVPPATGLLRESA